MKFKFLWLFMAVFVLSCVGVSAQEVNGVVGISLPATDGAFYGGVVESAQVTADDLGLDLIVVDAGYDVEQEAANIATLIDAGVEVLLFTPTDAVASLMALQSAINAGMSVFLFGGDIDLGMTDIVVDVVDLIGTSYAADGETAAAAMCDYVGASGEVLEIVNFDAESEDLQSVQSRERSAAFHAALSAQCANAEVISFDLSAVAADDVAQSLVSELRAVRPDGVIAYDDASLLMTLEALLAARQPRASVLGFNASDDVLAAVRMGYLKATISAEPFELGQFGVETAFAFLSGDDLTEREALLPVAIDASLLEAVRRVCTGGCD